MTRAVAYLRLEDADFVVFLRHGDQVHVSRLNDRDTPAAVYTLNEIGILTSSLLQLTGGRLCPHRSISMGRCEDCATPLDDLDRGMLHPQHVTNPVDETTPMSSPERTGHPHD